MSVTSGSNVNPHIAKQKARLEDVFTPAKRFQVPKQVRAMGVMPYFRELERNEGPTCIIEGRECVMLGSNNYLGLTTDQRVREAAITALREQGPSLTGSRLLNGTTKAHVALERKIAELLGREDALVFTTGYQANVGILTALGAEGSCVVVDWQAHASIQDGARTSKARVDRFQHNDAEDLERVLQRARDRGEASLVMVDGLYSMEGDILPLPWIVEKCRKHNARLCVDDAHALGVLGATGRGTEEHFGMHGAADLICGTFSKSLASIGGWVAGPSDVIDWMRFFGRPMVFSASLPPASVAAASTALDIMLAEPWRVARVNENAEYWRRGLNGLGFETGASASPIVPVIIGDDLKAIMMGKQLLDAGVYVNPVVHPAVPRDMAMLRTSVMASHDKAHLDRALEIMERIARKLRVL
jgi:8-amino-7-oxononanoate synthase